jgi:hypothetical protein
MVAATEQTGAVRIADAPDAARRGASRRRTRWALGWFAGQATATVVWWLLLAVSDRVRGWFEMSDDRAVLSSFVLADLVLIVGGSLVTAVALWRRAQWAGWVAMATAGAVAYATLYLVAWKANGGDGWLGLVAMMAATVGSAAAAVPAARPPMWADRDIAPRLPRR